MKKFLAILMFPTVLLASGSFVVEMTNKVATASSTTKTASGYLESIHVDVTGTTTGTLSILANGEVLFTNAVAITADTVYRPRKITHYDTGAAIGSATSGYERIFFDYDTVTFNLSETAPVTNTYKITVKVSRP